MFLIKLSESCLLGPSVFFVDYVNADFTTFVYTICFQRHIQYLAMSVSDECYSRNSLCSLNKTSKFYNFF